MKNEAGAPKPLTDRFFAVGEEEHSIRWEPSERASEETWARQADERRAPVEKNELVTVRYGATRTSATP